MFIKKTMLVLMCLQTAHLQKSHLMNILESENNLYHKINVNIHTIMNKLFTSLKLKNDFAKPTNIQLLLTLHSDFNKIVEKNCRVYEELKNISDVNTDRKNNLDKILQNIIKEEINNLKNNSITVAANETATVNNKFENNTLITSSSQLPQNFLKNIHGFTTEDAVNVTLNETNIRRNESLQITTFRNIKAWTPPMSGSDSSNGTRRIYRGRKTRIKSFPFLVSLHVMSKFTCAGSIVSKELVITAASCLQAAYDNKMYLTNPRTTFVRIGSDYTKRFGELIPVTQIIFHPKYDPATLWNNLAIVRLVKRIKFTNKRKIKRIKYDKTGAALSDDVKSVTILGWGATNEKHKISSLQKLSVTSLDIYNTENCREIYSKYYVTDKHFCAGFTSKGGGACNGDVGGPAIVSGLLVGIISFGSTVCGMPDAPTVFTLLHYYTDWIEDIIDQKSPQDKYTRSTTTTTTLKPLVPYTPRTPNVVAKAKDLRTESTEEHYPEEILILRKIIQDIILANSSVVDYILYGDLAGEDLSSSVEKTNMRHSIENKNAFIIAQIDKLNITSSKIVKQFTEKLQYKEVTGAKIDNLEAFSRPTQSFENVSTLTPSQYIQNGPVEKVEIYKKSITRRTPENADYTETEELNLNFGVKQMFSDDTSYYEDGIPIDVTQRVAFQNLTGIDYFFGTGTSTTKKISKFTKLMPIDDKESFNDHLNTYKKDSSKKFGKISRDENVNDGTRKMRYKNELKTVRDVSKVLDNITSKTLTGKLGDIQEIIKNNPWPDKIILPISDYEFVDDGKPATKFRKKYTKFGK